MSWRALTSGRAGREAGQHIPVCSGRKLTQPVCCASSPPEPEPEPEQLSKKEAKKAQKAMEAFAKKEAKSSKKSKKKGKHGAGGQDDVNRLLAAAGVDTVEFPAAAPSSGSAAAPPGAVFEQEDAPTRRFREVKADAREVNRYKSGWLKTRRFDTGSEPADGDKKRGGFGGAMKGGRKLVTGAASRLDVRTIFSLHHAHAICPCPSPHSSVALRCCC